MHVDFQYNLQFFMSGSSESCFRENILCPIHLLSTGLENLKNHNITSVLKILLKDLSRFMTSILPNNMVFSDPM